MGRCKAPLKAQMVTTHRQNVLEVEREYKLQRKCDFQAQSLADILWLSAS